MLGSGVNGQPKHGSNASITMVLWRKKAPKPKEEEVPAAPMVAAQAVPAAPAEQERLPPPAAFRASQEIANRNFCDDDDEDQSVEFAASESLVREALCGRIDPPPAGPLTARSEALSEATTARAPSRESSPRGSDAAAVRTVSFDAPPPLHRPQSGRPPRPVTAEAVSRALRRARGGYVDDADDDDGASDDEDPDPVAAAPDEERVRPPDPAQRMRLVEMEIPSFAERFPFAPDSPVQERRAARPSTAGPGAAGRAPTFAVARRPATAGPRRRRRSEDALACLRAPLDLSLCDFLDDLVNLCDAAEAAEKRRTA